MFAPPKNFKFLKRSVSFEMEIKCQSFLFDDGQKSLNKTIYQNSLISILRGTSRGLIKLSQWKIKTLAKYQICQWKFFHFVKTILGWYFVFIISSVAVQAFQ